MLKIVKIFAERGYGSDMWEIVSEDADQYFLKHLNTGNRITLYKLHCFTDRDTIRETVKLRESRANNIGRKR